MKQRIRNCAVGTGKLVLIVAIATVLGKFFVKQGFPETNIVIIYILAVLFVARFTNGYLYGVAASIVSVLCFNYYFTAPYHTLLVNDPNYFITFAIMVMTAIVTSALTTKEKLLTKEAEERGLANQVLYTLSSQLSDATDIESVIKIAVQSISTLLNVNAGGGYVGGISREFYIQQVGEQQVHQMPDNMEEYYCYPVKGPGVLRAYIRVRKSETDAELLKEKDKLLHSILENISLALERMEATMERIRDREKIEKERYRANLLRAISHDLRTPLSGIIGTTEILMEMTGEEDRRYPFIKGIHLDADWLRALVENILSLTRLQDGKVKVHKEMEAMEEVIACAVSHVEKMSLGREIQVEIPSDFHLVPMDARLIEQVLTNLLGNAIKHTEEEEEIIVGVCYENACVRVSVKDGGEGVDEQDIPNIFQMFYTSDKRGADVKKGIGLGLTICETIIQAHGGTIEGKNRKDAKGAEFSFTLPFEGDEKHE